MKKTISIAVVSALMISGALNLSMWLTKTQELELAVTNIPEENNSSQDPIPLYYDEEEILLLPIRNVMESLGGKVEWKDEEKIGQVSYGNRKVSFAVGESEAIFNGYDITLPKVVQSINGILYVESCFFSEYFGIEIIRDEYSQEIYIESIASHLPIIAVKEFNYKEEEQQYKVQVPVVLCLNDSIYERKINKEIMMYVQRIMDEFVLEEVADKITLEVHQGYIGEEFISLCWKGEEDGEIFYKTININLKEQRLMDIDDILTRKDLFWDNKETQLEQDISEFFITEDKNIHTFFLEDGKWEVQPSLLFK